MVALLEMLALRGLKPNPTTTKIVRHRDKRYDVELLLRQGWLEAYQSFQGKTIFDRCELLLSFIGEESGRSRFFGAFDVGSRSDAAMQVAMLPSGCPHVEWASAGRHHYALDRRRGLEDLEDRLVIDFGNGARMWHQWLSDKEIVELTATGRSLPPFDDYQQVSLTHRELVTLVDRPEAHRDWRSQLQAVGGIYLILASHTGQQYVGSATGAGGLWQRWSQYAQTGHGGNQRLKQLVQDDPGCPNAFVYSILHTFSRTTVRQHAQELEALFKRKLGSRALGLNAN